MYLVRCVKERGLIVQFIDQTTRFGGALAATGGWNGLSRLFLAARSLDEASLKDRLQAALQRPALRARLL
jgi:hypothetical protein